MNRERYFQVTMESSGALFDIWKQPRYKSEIILISETSLVIFRELKTMEDSSSNGLKIDSIGMSRPQSPSSLCPNLPCSQMVEDRCIIIISYYSSAKHYFFPYIRVASRLST